MEKKAWVRIKGIQRDGQGKAFSDPVLLETEGSYYLKDGSHYVLYQEPQGDTREIAKSFLQVSERGIKMRKKGKTSSMVQICQQETKPFLYITPYGSLSFSAYGREVSVMESKEKVLAKASYRLEQGENFVAECTLEIEIRIRE